MQYPTTKIFKVSPIISFERIFTMDKKECNIYFAEVVSHKVCLLETTAVTCLKICNFYVHKIAHIWLMAFAKKNRSTNLVNVFYNTFQVTSKQCIETVKSNS